MANTLKLSDVLSKIELRELRLKSDFKAFIILVGNWGLIVLCLILPTLFPNPVIALIAIIFLGGRQLALGIIMHDCAHNAFFKTPKLNELAGHWFAGAPINGSLLDYREYHLEHHKYAGTNEDPDLIFVKNYPVSKASLRRKFIRDLTGQTGFRDTIHKLKTFRFSKNYPWLVFHVVLFSILTSFGAAWAYLLWWCAELFVYPAIVRLRQIGEHGTAVDRGALDPRLNTGTTIAPWWQRIFVAPNNVNYHLEHHHLASIPPYNLKQLHQHLMSRGYYDGFDCISYGYGDVIRRAIRRNPVV